MSWMSGARARMHLILNGRAAESRMDEEIGFHVDMETDRLIREERLPPDEARRRALVAFGGVTQHKETLREGRGTAWLAAMRLDLKLGLRMLRRYPGLTVVGALAMAFAIWVGTVTFEVMTLFTRPVLPLPNGDRIVQLRNWDTAADDPEPRALHDFLLWRESLASVTDLGAWRDVTRNLIADDNTGGEVRTAEISASAFRIAPTAPMLGRVLIPTDELPGSPSVVVLGYDVWRMRFASDSQVIGRTAQLGDERATVVGVMPAGFEFPVSHDLWTPLRTHVFDRSPREGPPITVFGRLADGATFESAQAELSGFGRRAALEWPATHQRLQAQVRPYAKLYWEPAPGDVPAMYAIYGFALMLLVLVASTVALLLFARAATREGELVVRSALGASRRRIVMQLFAEALVLGAVAAALGLGAAAIALDEWGMNYLEVNMGRMPFWFDPGLSPSSVLYAIGLTVLAAAIAGVLPALKVTRGLGSQLRRGSAGGGGLQFGGVWTAVIIAQVAVTVAFPAVVWVEQRELRRIQSFDVGFAAEEYLGVELDMDSLVGAGADDEESIARTGARFGASLEVLRQRVASEPGVGGVTFTDELPRLRSNDRLVEVDGVMDTASATRKVASSQLRRSEASTALIDPSYFDVLESPILAGRAFNAADVASGARVMIVDEGFVDLILRGRNPIGQRVRFASYPQADGTVVEQPWHEVVGVVRDLGMAFMAQQRRAAGVYMPIKLASGGPLNMMVQVRGDPMSLGPRVRELAATVDPMLRVTNLQRLNEVTEGILWLLGVWLKASVVLTGVALLLSLAGIYSMLSFTVARRTREIGVRVALGASRGQLVAAIFRRPLIQVGSGVVAGVVLIGVAAHVLARQDAFISDGLSLGQVGVLVMYAGLMMGVCLLACVVPTRRALRVEPAEALRVE